MKQQLINYLQTPTLENFMSLRGSVVATDGFNPYSSELDEVPALMEVGDFEGVVKTILDNLSPNHFLSPEAHLHLGFAYHKLGYEKESEMEQMISALLMRGIEQTGDGTEAQPFLVSRTSDEYDYLSEHDLTLVSQALVERAGREFDVMSVKEQDAIWFDITEIRLILDRMLGLSESD